ncbi:MAG: hypothetical protein R3C97_07625 [Geminicoccaceae bacterium]
MSDAFAARSENPQLAVFEAVLAHEVDQRYRLAFGGYGRIRRLQGRPSRERDNSRTGYEAIADRENGRELLGIEFIAGHGEGPGHAGQIVRTLTELVRQQVGIDDARLAGYPIKKVMIYRNSKKQNNHQN